MCMSLVPMTLFVADNDSVSTFSGTVDEKLGIADVERYTVLIFDTSGSMLGTPATEQKGAATKFCESVLNSAGRNYIAIVKLSTTSAVGCEFTDDLSILTNYISGIPATIVSNDL